MSLRTISTFVWVDLKKKTWLLCYRLLSICLPAHKQSISQFIFPTCRKDDKKEDKKDDKKDDKSKDKEKKSKKEKKKYKTKLEVSSQLQIILEIFVIEMFNTECILCLDCSPFVSRPYLEIALVECLILISSHCPYYQPKNPYIDKYGRFVSS